MSEQRMAQFALSEMPLQASMLRAALEHPQAGAFAGFEGWVRNHNDGRQVAGLRYEAYASLAQAEGQRVLDDALARFPILAAHCVHRVGELAIGDMAVWVGVSAAHRGAAFEACRFIIDEVKARVPIWKHEHYLDGDAGWLHPQEDQR
ncbi:molybdopterin-converting factor chain 2 [Xanthomonas maliensis]|nr:molybdopterin-converting factor chain 2 [Xanthomonas maliensis]